MTVPRSSVPAAGSAASNMVDAVSVTDPPDGPAAPEALALGRRARGKRDKSARILAAAESLFAERGYAAVTTQEIADRADVAGGTLFRYATTKAELLLMVYNVSLARGIDAGRAASLEGATLADRIALLLEPLVASASRHRENTAVYQREILFGDPTGEFRAEALVLIGSLESAIARELRSADDEPLRPGADADLAARGIFATLHMALVHAGLRGDDETTLRTDLRRQVDLAIHGVVDVGAATS